MLSDDTLKAGVYFGPGAAWFTPDDSVTGPRGLGSPIYGPQTKPSAAPGRAGTGSYRRGMRRARPIEHSVSAGERVFRSARR